MSDASGSPLRDAASPFLRHGAAQPVSWEPWGVAAFQRARAEDRPVLLDIGAVWCHWCHVMDRESYDDEATATLIDAHFVAVKVDRDERPDVDARYQRAVQGLTGQGGWPLTVFLTPDGEAFYGGTYFPPADAHGRPSFRRVLTEVARLWREDRARALASADELRRRLAESESALRQGGDLSPALVDEVVEALADAFDFRHGGFGRAPKFPNPGGLQLLLDRWLDGGEDWARRVVHESLTAMGRGGICDQLGGGFHRYATDARWLIPHFEKMAADNGALLETYARAAAALDEPFFGRVAEGVVRYYANLEPDLLEQGGFPASQDADAGPADDGDYWTWTRHEIAAELEGGGNGAAGDDGAAGGEGAAAVEAALLRYGLDDDAAAMPGDPDRHVLYLARAPADVAEALGESDTEAVARHLGEAACRLIGARDRRPRPFVDTTVYSGWTALVASGHLAAARHLGAAHAAAPALRALERIWREAWREGVGVRHRVGDDGSGALLADQAFVAQACIDAFEPSQAAYWLERARALGDVLLERFLDADGDGFLDRPAGEAAVGALARAHRPVADAPEASGNGAAALALLRLSAYTGEPRYEQAALRTLRAFAGSARRLGTAAATYFRAVDWALRPLTSVVVVGESADPAEDALFGAALRVYRPRTVLRRLPAAATAASEALAAPAAPEALAAPATGAEPASPPRSSLKALPEALRAMVTAQAPRAYVCVGQTCAAPVSDPDELGRLLRELRS